MGDYDDALEEKEAELEEREEREAGAGRGSRRRGRYPSLGQRIKKERLARGMTQRELAVAVGITVPYMSKIEADRETPTEEKIKKLAEVLGLVSDELILAAGRMPSDVMERLAADPTRGVEFLRRVRKWWGKGGGRWASGPLRG